MIASLPMYDRAETAAANDRLWALVRARLPQAPERLSRDPDRLWQQWRDPRLVLSQCCGLPYPMELCRAVTLVAAPVYDLPDASGTYFSKLICRAEDPRDRLEAFADARLAINETASQSGWGILCTLAGPGLADTVIATGAHRESARAVAEGRADFASIDAVTWRMIERWDAFAGRLRVFGETPRSPAPPYITARGNDPVPLRAALTAAVTALDTADRDTLCLSGIAPAAHETYMAMPLAPEPLARGAA